MGGSFSLERYLREKDIDFKAHDSGSHIEYAINCPKCIYRGESTPDNKKKLWINAKNEVYYCYRCDWSGSLVYLIKSLSNTSLDDAIKIINGSQLSSFDHLDLHLNIDEEDYDEDDEIDLREIELPYGYNPIDGPHEYLEERGIPWEYAEENDWGYSDAGYTKNRIIVPTFVDHKLVFWQARATWDSDHPDFKKVLNPKGVSARSVLYNYDTASTYDRIIITEGFIDAVKVGPDAVATNGKRIHPQQCQLLAETNAKELIIAWDEDAWTDARPATGSRKAKPSSIEKAAGLLKSYSFIVRGARLPKNRDCGSYPYRSPDLRMILENSIIL